MSDSDRPAARRGLLRRAFGGVWWLIDGARRLVFNLVFVALLAGLLFALWRGAAAPLQDKTTLVLALRGPLVEQVAGGGGPARLQRLAEGEGNRQVRLRDLLAVLDAAAKDARIVRVLLVLDDFAGAGLPQLREAAAAVGRVRAAGKEVVAWGSSYDQRSYYLAAHADAVYLHPMGAIELQGYGRLRNFYKDALDRLGVEPNVIRAGKFKSFGESFSNNAPSKEALQADAFLYDGLWASYTEGVERARKLPAGTIGRGIEEAPQRLAAAGGDFAKMVLDAKLVDGLKTRDELRRLLIERGAEDKENKTFVQINFADYLARQKSQRGGDAIGIVVAEGAIGDGDAPAGRIGGRSTAEIIRSAREDDQIKALVLRVNSPGGSAFGSELVRRELELTRAAGKPVVVSMGDVAASGGYWISTAADEVLADPATVTGSIGVIAILPTAGAAMDKLAIRTGGYTTTWLGKAYDPRTGLDPRLAQMVQVSIDHAYDQFKARVATARKSTPDKIDTVAQGRVWTGAQALERGLVDRLGGLTEAVQAAATRAKLAGVPTLRYLEREPGKFDRVLEMLGAGAFVDALAAPWFASWLPLLPTAAQPVLDDLAFLADVGQGRRPFSAAVHCFCASP